MIERIAITDFAVARSVVIELGPGLTVFTGETGAGKSIAVDALAFAFGARKGREVVATGADRAIVQVSFTLAGEKRTIERSIGLSGRSTTLLDGAQATVADVQALAEASVDIHGQAEQLSILRPAVQLQVLDEFAGLGPSRAEVGVAVRELRELRRRITALATDARERERLVEQLSYESNEIEAAALQPSEDEALRIEHARLANAGRLIEDATRALEALDSSAVGEVVSTLGDLTTRDPSAEHVADLLLLFQGTADELARAARQYRDALDSDPEALSRLEERLDLIARLRRKYGETVDEVLAYGRDARARLASLTGAEGSLEALREREIALLAGLADQAQVLSAARRLAASGLVAAIGAELESLGMGNAALALGFACEDDAQGPIVSLPDYDLIAAGPVPPPAGEPLPRAITESGVDRVEFLASFNAGEAPRALSAVASGGETSRFLLALATVLGGTAEPRLIVFDEVDEGVGGRAGGLVGAALARLARGHQVLCITHLPQVAAHGERHYTVTKHTDGARTWTEVSAVAGEARVMELASMLGGHSAANISAAAELMAAAAVPSANRP